MSSFANIDNEVFGAWGNSAGLVPELIERSKYLQYLELLECFNNFSSQASGTIAAAVVFGSPTKGVFLLGSAEGDMIMTGTICKRKVTMNPDRWIGDKGRTWLVRTTNDRGPLRIKVYQDPYAIRSSGLLSRLSNWLNPWQFEGTVRDDLVIPILTEFFAMKPSIV